MEFKDLVSLYFERSNAMQVLWSIYITLALGLLAFFGTAKSSSRKTFLAIVLSIGFVGFAYVNQDALCDVTNARNTARDLIFAYTDAKPANQAIINRIKPIITPPTTLSVRLFHIGVDIGVLIAIWSLTLYREKRPNTR